MYRSIPNRRTLSARTCAILVAASSAFALVPHSSAAPYAGEVSYNSATGVLTYNLSESADDVTINVNGTPMDLSGQASGPQSINIGAAVPNYKIVVSKLGAAGYQTRTAANTGTVQKISDDGTFMSFNSPRGIAVNQSPTSPTFGRIYVANSAAGTSSGAVSPVRGTGDGIYVLGTNRSDVLAQGNTALNGGLNFGTGGASSPWRVEIDQGGNLFIADWADADGSVYVTDPNVTTGTNLLSGTGSSTVIAPTPALNHGSIVGLKVSGKLGSNLTLYTVDEDLSATATPTDLNSLWTYNVGATTSGYNGLPTEAAQHPLIGFVATGGVVCDVARGPDGKSYLIQNRTDGNEPGVSVLSADGSQLLYSSLADTARRGLDADTTLAGTQDIFRTITAVDVSPDGKWMALCNNNSTAVIVPLIDGIPDMPNRINLATFPAVASGRDIAFDAADNLYEVSSGNAALRVFSPGGLSQTIYDSAGSFTSVTDPTWTFNGSGNITDASKWLLSFVPNSQGLSAVFGPTNSSTATINVNAPFTLGQLYINSPNGYNFSGSSTITLSSLGEPRVQLFQSNSTISAPVVMTGNTQFTVSQGTSTLTVTNLSFSGTAGITKAGAGTLVLSSPNAASGTSNINGGVLRLDNGGVLQSSVTNINADNSLMFANTINSATLGGLGGTGSLALTNLGGGAVALTVGGSLTGNLTYSGPISGLGSLIKTGTGREILTGTNSYSGTTTIAGGILRADENIGLVAHNLVLNGGLIESNNNITRPLGNGDNQLQLPGGVSGFSSNADINVDIGGDGGGSGPQLVWGTTFFNPSALGFSTSTGTASLHFRNAVDLGGVTRSLSSTATGTAEMTGTISHGGINKIGSGTLFLTNDNNSFAGGATLTAGQLGISNDGNIGGATQPLTFAGGILAIKDNNIHDINSHPYNNTSFNGGFNILDGGNTFTVSQPLSGTGSLTKLGDGTLVLTASNSYTGGTTIGGGTIPITADNNLGALNGTVTLNGGSLQLLTSVNDTRPIVTGINGGTIDMQQNSATFLNVTGTGTFSKQGNATLTVNGIRITSQLIIQDGTIVIPAGRSVSKLTNVASIDLQGHTLDLNDNDLIMDYSHSGTPDPLQLDFIHDQINNSYNGGLWNNSGLKSSAAAAAAGSPHPTALGYAEASATGLKTFDGVTTDKDMILVRYTYSGDANLDGTVNALDFNVVATNFGVSGKDRWQYGDFNFDNTVDNHDFTAMAQNFGLSIQPGAALGSLVPEPGALSFLALAIASTPRRRRR